MADRKSAATREAPIPLAIAFLIGLMPARRQSNNHGFVRFITEPLVGGHRQGNKFTVRKGGGEPVMGKEPDQECGSLEAAIHLRSVALAYIQENRRILELLKTGVVTEEHNESFDVALGCLSDLEIVSRDIQQALALLPDLS